MVDPYSSREEVPHPNDLRQFLIGAYSIPCIQYMKERRGTKGKNLSTSSAPSQS